MAENDIYNSKGKYERFKGALSILTKAEPGRKYVCKNPDNLAYFQKLFLRFEAQDLSYVRRLRLLHVLKIVVHNTSKELKDLARDDIDAIVTFVNERMSAKTISDFKVDIKFIWKSILPDSDERGRSDETVHPYVVRHLKTNIDKSREIGRKDRLSWPEFEKIVAYFSNKPCLQAYLMLALESLGRPQELLWRRIKDVELYDNYAKIHLTSHGKEGVGLLQCIDSYSYVTAWLNKHPYRNDPESFLFVNEVGNQLTPIVINKHLRIAFKKLGIHKPVTCYSLKRNGVSFRRLRGDSDVEIQKAARWTSTKQLKTYDLTDQEDAFKLELIKRGIVEPGPEHAHLRPKTQPCVYCKTPNKFTDVTCHVCNRPLDRKKVMKLEREKELEALHEFMSIPQIKQLFKTVYSLKKKIESTEVRK